MHGAFENKIMVPTRKCEEDESNDFHEKVIYSDWWRQTGTSKYIFILGNIVYERWEA